jgi:hypothetical protein
MAVGIGPTGSEACFGEIFAARAQASLWQPRPGVGLEPAIRASQAMGYDRAASITSR